MTETHTHYIRVTTKNEEETWHVAGDIEDRLDSFVVAAAPFEPFPEPVTAELEPIQAAPGIFVSVNVFRGEPVDD